MKYDLIYIDPPWNYNSRKSSGERKDKTKFGGGAIKHYSLMKDKELLEFKSTINEISEDRSIMFMWATCPRLDFAIELMEHWGYSYKTVAFAWVKTNKDNSYRVNPGYYTASNIEPVLLGVKGKNQGLFKPAKAMQNQIIAEPIREHSRKPDKVRKKIELMYPSLRKIEVFAREKKDGWSHYGNETNKFTLTEDKG